MHRQVVYPQKWRHLTTTGEDDPSAYWPCGLWWFSFVCFGGPPRARQPASGTICASPSSIDALQPNRPRPSRLLWPIVFFAACCAACVLLATSVTWLAFGAVPLGNMFCGIRANAAFLLFVHPLVEVVHGVCHLQLLHAALQIICPWRLWLQFSALVYVLSVLWMLPIVVLAGNFPMQGLLMPIAGAATRVGLFCWHRSRLCCDELAWQRWRDFHAFEALALLATAIYGGYICLFHLFPTQQTLLAFLLFVVEVFLRKTIQHCTLSISRETAFLLCGLWVYSLHYTAAAFSAPNVDSSGDHSEKNAKTYFALALHPVLNTVMAICHQSDIWMRFRCWIKCTPKVLVCGTLTSDKAMPIAEDTGADMHGTTNAHPDYRRAKVALDFYCFAATLLGYGSFLLCSPLFRFGANRGHFPYAAGSSILDHPYTNTQFARSLKFASIVCTIVACGFVVFAVFLRIALPGAQYVQLVTLARAQLVASSRLLHSAMLIATSTLLTVVSLLLYNNRVWYLHGDSPLFPVGYGLACNISAAARW